MEELKKHIRDIPDFPKEGILFRDITTLLNNKDVFKKVYFINPKSRLNLDVLNFEARSLIKDLVKQIKRILKSGSDEDILEIKNCINN